MRAVIAALAALSLPYWLPGVVVRLRMRLFTWINGPEGVPVPGPLVGADRFKQVYGDPGADGRSRGAVLSDLFWYWLSPGAHVHQEHLEPGPRYDEVARRTREVLSLPSAQAAALARRCLPAPRTGFVRLRDLMMPVWAAYFYELVFGAPCPPHARDLIVGNAHDVVTSLKCLGLRHMDRRERLTRYLLDHLDETVHPLPSGLTREEQAWYLQGTFFNTAVVQQSEATAHLLLVLAARPRLQAQIAAGDEALLDRVMEETFRLYPLFGIAHRIASRDIVVDEKTTLPAGSVLCFDYAAYHRTGFERPHRFDPSRWERLRAKDVHHIPFGVAANRPCPAWRLSPIALRAVTLALLETTELRSSARHTRALPNRAPCLLVSRGSRSLAVRPALAVIRVRDRWEDVGRSLVQLVLGTWMVWDAQRLGLCRRSFSAASERGPEIRDAFSFEPDLGDLVHGDVQRHAPRPRAVLDAERAHGEAAAVRGLHQDLVASCPFTVPDVDEDP